MTHRSSSNLHDGNQSFGLDQLRHIHRTVDGSSSTYDSVAKNVSMRNNVFLVLLWDFVLAAWKSKKKIYRRVGILEPIYVEHWNEYPIVALSQVSNGFIFWYQEFIQNVGGRCGCDPFTCMNVRFNEDGWIALWIIKANSINTSARQSLHHKTATLASLYDSFSARNVRFSYDFPNS